MKRIIAESKDRKRQALLLTPALIVGVWVAGGAIALLGAFETGNLFLHGLLHAKLGLVDDRHGHAEFLGEFRGGSVLKGDGAEAKVVYRGALRL